MSSSRPAPPPMPSASCPCSIATSPALAGRRCRLPQEVRHRRRRHGQEPLGLSPAAQLSRRDRGRDLLLQTSLWRSTLHLARARPLQGLHLVGGGGPQPGAARPPETGVASPAAAGDSAAGQINPPDPTRYTIPAPRAATATRKCAGTCPNRTTARLATPLKIMRLWTGTS